MSEKKYSTYKEFWPFYLSQHKHTLNRFLHRVGTLLSIILFFYLITQQLWIQLLLVPIVGYSFAWFGHFVIEKNVPATFTYPIWSFISDLRMLFRFR